LIHVILIDKRVIWVEVVDMNWEPHLWTFLTLDFLPILHHSPLSH
jgi:hypothetical protein